jgi:cell division transport system permease protein
MRQGAADLLPKTEGHDVGLFFTVAVMAFLACVAMLGALGADRAARGWTEDLSAGVTVQVKPGQGETGAEAAARAAEALAGVKGVKEARAMDRKSAEALLEPWLGKGNIPADLPLPQLVTVELASAAPASHAALDAALVRAHVDGAVDDHRQWMRDLRQSADLVRLFAVAACLLLAASAGAVIAFATRQGLAAERDIVEVLHLCGAEDGFVAGLFMVRFARLALIASAAGAGVAGLLAALVKLFGASDHFAPSLPLQWTDLLVPAAAPVLGALVAALSARRAALAILKAQT